MITVKTEMENKTFDNREMAVQWIYSKFVGQLVSRGVFVGPRDAKMRDYTEFSIVSERKKEAVARLYDPEDTDLEQWN